MPLSHWADKCAACDHARGAHAVSQNGGCGKRVMRSTLNGLLLPAPRLMPCNCPRFREPCASADPDKAIANSPIDLSGWDRRK